MSTELILSKSDRSHIAKLIEHNVNFTESLVAISDYFLKKGDYRKSILFSVVAANAVLSLYCCNLFDDIRSNKKNQQRKVQFADSPTH